MLKKIIIVALVIMTVVTAAVPMAMADSGTWRKYANPVTMYVYTQNGGPLNVRLNPDTNSALIGNLPFGTAVTVTGTDTTRPNWVSIRYSAGNNGTGWVMSQFLTTTRPSEKDIEQAEVNRQMATYRAFDSNFTVSANPTSSTGWVNFRSAPSTHSSQIGTLYQGHLLTVVGETMDWYQAVDNVTGRLGWVMKAYVYRLA